MEKNARCKTTSVHVKSAERKDDHPGGKPSVYLLVLVFGSTNVRLVLFHGVQLDAADGARVAL